jgi:hypothetical protein
MCPLRKCSRVLREFAERYHAVPIGSALPFAFVILPGLFRCHRERGDGRAVRCVVKVGVLSGKSDNR